MKEQVWYHAVTNEIIIKQGWLAERGSQASVGGVPDYMGVYDWPIDPDVWNEHAKQGWLVYLGEL